MGGYCTGTYVQYGVLVYEGTKKSDPPLTATPPPPPLTATLSDYFYDINFSTEFLADTVFYCLEKILRAHLIKLDLLILPGYCVDWIYSLVPLPGGLKCWDPDKVIVWVGVDFLTLRWT